MAQKKYYQLKTSSRLDWLKARSNFIGASEISAIAGLDEYTPKVSVWEKKTNQVSIDDKQNNYTLFGHVAENFLSSYYEYGEFYNNVFLPDTYDFNVENKNKLRSVQKVNGLLVNLKYPMFACTPDRIIKNNPDYPNQRGLVEIKTIGFEADKWEMGVPPKYVLQCQWQMLITGFDYVDLLLYNRMDCSTTIFHIERRQDTIDTLINLGLEFWSLVENTREFLFDKDVQNLTREEVAQLRLLRPSMEIEEYATKGMTDYLKEKYKDRGGFMQGNDELLQFAKQSLLMKIKEEEAKAQSEAFRNCIKDHIGEYSGVDFGEKGEITYKANVKGVRSLLIKIKANA